MSTSVVLEWKNLNLCIEKREFSLFKCRTRIEKKRILDNVSGNLKSGQLVAILGSSGAGKTTLLASVSQRFRGPLKGQILINGSSIDRKTMTKISCFVPQFDITLNSLTPNEHMYFMSQLKLDRKWSRSRKNQRIELLLREMGLQSVANNRISTLSGGERKKLNLATDLLTNPPIVFCDEPTTGLDSYNAGTVIKALKYLTNFDRGIESSDASIDSVNGLELMPTVNQWNKMPPKAVICSIHQPTSDIFQCFSHIILMYSGRCVFQGTADEAFQHFSKLGFHCPTAYNPPDFYLKVLSSTPENEFGKAEKSFFQRPIETLRQSIEYKPANVENVGTFNVTDFKIRSPFWIEQVWLLLMRSLLNNIRNYREILIELAMYLIPYIAMALLYHETTGRTQESVQDVTGAIVIITCELIFTMSYGVIHFYPSQMPILRRETNEHIYQFSAFYLSEMFSVWPVSFLRAFIGLAITYVWAGFRRGFLLYFQFGLILFVTAFTANAYGLFMSGIFKSITMEVSSVFDLIFLCMSGIYINLDAFPYIRYISLFYFSNEALSIGFWHNVTAIECSTKFSGHCLKNGTEVLESMSYHSHYDFIVWDVIGLLVLGVIMHALAFIGIRRIIRSVGYY